MADNNYENIPSIIGIYEGTVASFEAIMKGSDEAKKKTFYGRLILITGTDADKKQAIWASEDDGTNAHYLNMSDVATLKAQLAHVDGLAFPKSDVAGLYDAYDLTGGKGFILEGSNGITVKLDPSDPETVNDKPFWIIEVNGVGLIGTSLNGSNPASCPNTITGAKKYTDEVAMGLKGIKAENDNTADTIRGAKDYADKVAESKADLENGKIIATQLPDYILGQMLFGGTLDGGTTSQMTVTPTANLLDKIGKTEADLNTEGKLVITNTSFETYEGVYFISSINFGNTNVVNIPDVRIGDWIISTGTNWRKVDNTDAIVKVAGVTPVNGDIDASALAEKLSETGVYIMPDAGIPETDLATEVATKINQSVKSVSGDGFITVTDTSTQQNGKSYEVSAKTKTMERAKEDILLPNGEDALATAHDVYNFIKARLSVKIIS